MTGKNRLLLLINYRCRSGLDCNANDLVSTFLPALSLGILSNWLLVVGVERRYATLTKSIIF